MRELYAKYKEVLERSLQEFTAKLPNLIRYKEIVESLEVENGGITRKGYSSFMHFIPNFALTIAEATVNHADELSKTVIQLAVDEVARTLTDEEKRKRAEEIYRVFADTPLFGRVREQWREWLSHSFSETLRFTTFPGRSTLASVSSINQALTDPAYPNSIFATAVMYIRAVATQSLRDAVVESFLYIGRSKVELKCNHPSEVCQALAGVYDVRFLPEIPSADCTCELDIVKNEPMEYPQKVTVNREPIVVPTDDDLVAKIQQLERVQKNEVAKELYEKLLMSELDFMSEAYNAFATDKYAAGKAFGRTASGRNTVSFGDEIEILAKYIYGGEATSVKTPVDIINPIFGIEAKASSAMERSEQERGHIAAGEVVRKYLFTEKLRREGRSQGYHKYVLGVFDIEKDKVTVYEQNYYSNKNSATMIPVCTIRNYSKLQWAYESTPYREFKVVDLIDGIPEEYITWYRTREELNDPFYWEVQRAHRANTRDGDIVLHFDGEKLRKGVLFDKSVPEEQREYVRYNFEKYHHLFPRRAAYVIQTDERQLVEWLNEGSIESPTLFEEWNVAGIVLEFKDVHHLPEYHADKNGVYKVATLPLDYMTTAFLTSEEYARLKPLFERAGLRLEPVTSARRIRRRTGTGRLEYDVIRPAIPAFQDKLVIKWEDGEIESVDYNTFNSKYRLLKQGTFETLEERGLEIPEDATDGTELLHLSVKEKHERIQAALAVLNQFAVK